MPREPPEILLLELPGYLVCTLQWWVLWRKDNGRGPCMLCQGLGSPTPRGKRNLGNSEEGPREVLCYFCLSSLSLSLSSSGHFARSHGDHIRAYLNDAMQYPLPQPSFWTIFDSKSVSQHGARCPESIAHTTSENSPFFHLYSQRIES